MKKFISILSLRWIKVFLVPVILLSLWLVLSAITAMTYKASFTVLPYNHVNDFSLSGKSGTLLAGEKIKGELKIKENNFGIIALRIHNYHIVKPIKEDTLLFRIKEKGQKKWYSENTYSGGQFYELELFPFGFVPIANSKDKTYMFEVVSQKGTRENALTFTKTFPILVTEYQFIRKDLSENKKLLLQFFYKKVAYALSNPDFYLTIFIYFLPFLLYIVWLSPFRQSTSLYLTIKVKRLMLILNLKQRIKISVIDVFIFLGFLLDILFITQINNLIVVVLSLLWLSRLLFCKYKSEASIFLALLFLILATFLLFLKIDAQAEKAATWTSIILGIGLFQAIIEQKK